jgi:hypothetical protein
VQIIASVEDGGSSLLQFSHVGLNSSMKKFSDLELPHKEAVKKLKQVQLFVM